MAGVYWKTLTVKIPEQDLLKLEEYRDENGFANLSEAARFALQSGMGYRTKGDSVRTIRSGAKAEAIQKLDYLIQEHFKAIREEFLEES